MALPNGEMIKIKLAITPKEQSKGLSGVSAHDYGKAEGMFFLYLKDGYRQFWMPDTYFDLDIIFLNKNLQVLEVIRKVPHHPGRETPPPIFKTKPVYCRYVLEIRADSPLATSIRKGVTLSWIGRQNLSEIESKIRLQR